MVVVSSAYSSSFPQKREPRDGNELRGCSWTPAFPTGQARGKAHGVTITAEA
jgi:hypothetical protein